MLNNQDLQWLINQIVGTAELLGQVISPTAAAMLADDLSSYDKPVLSAALSRVRTEYTGRLTPKAIIDRIDEAMGRPAANEAWAVALSALDERNTVIWTDEMAQAWSVASPIAKEGDLIGARMAFKDAYERLVRTAREFRLLPVISVSEGWDNQGRALAVEKAVALGYMTPQAAVAYLPAPKDALFNPVALLTGNVEISRDASPDVRARLMKLRDDIAKANARDAESHAAYVTQAAAELQARKDAAQRMADDYMLANDAESRESQRAKLAGVQA